MATKAVTKLASNAEKIGPKNAARSKADKERKE